MTAMIAAISRGIMPHMHRHSLIRSSLVVSAATVLPRTIRSTATVAALAPIRSAAATTHSLQHQFQYYSHLEQRRTYSTSIDRTLTATKEKQTSRKEISERKTLNSVHIDNLESIGRTKLVSLARYLGLTYILTRASIVKRIKTLIKSTPSMLLPDGSIDFKSAIFTNNQIYPEGLYSPRGYQLYLLCASLGISKQSSDDELIGGIYWHIHRNPSTMAGNSTVDLLSSSNTANDSTNNSTTKQSMEVVLKRLQECDRQQLESICNSFGIPTLRKHDTLIIMIQDHLRRNPFLLSKNGTIPPQLLLNYDVSQSNPLTVSSLTQLSRDQLRSFSDICGIPYDFTKAEYAVNIKKKLLDSASPLVGEGGMVNLQFTSRPLRKDIIDKYNKPVHIDSLEVLSSSQLLKFCKMIGIPSDKSETQLIEELRTYLVSTPYSMTNTGALISGNEHPLVKKKRRKKSRLRPLYLDSLDSLDRNDIWMMCGSYGVSTKIPKELLLERFRLYLSEHPEFVRADGTIDLGLSQI